MEIYLWELFLEELWDGLTSSGVAMIIDNGKTIYFKKEIQAPVEYVFSLWSDTDNIPNWWQPTVDRVEGKVQEGNYYKIFWRNQKDPNQSPYGIFTKVIPNQSIEMTWKWDAISPDFDSSILLNFNFIQNKTIFEFTHRGIQIPNEVPSHHEAWEEILQVFCEYAAADEM